MRELLLQSVLSQPSAPFREKHVISVITRELERGGVPHFLDPIGNVIVGARSKKEYLALIRRKSKEPVRVFIAHMDHPGFHGEKWLSDQELEIKWHGGSPTKDLEGARVWIASSGGLAGDGVMTDAKLIPSGRGIESATIRFQRALSKTYPDPKSLYGGFTFREFYWRDGDLVYTKAADDLVGTFAVTSLALDLFSPENKKNGKKAKDLPFLGVLTRAEEVGFIGALGHLELGWLKQARRPVICVSLETSRTLPGAEIGKGPVVRQGDKFTVFDAAALRVFADLAEKILPGAYQKRVMDGGTCEASTATVYGYRCIGISVPLGNYHNQNFEGGPDSRAPLGPAPEFVHMSDIDGLLKLCAALLKPKLPWNDPWTATKRKWKAEFKASRALLRSGP